jgi:hypothetical protein
VAQLCDLGGERGPFKRIGQPARVQQIPDILDGALPRQLYRLVLRVVVQTLAPAYDTATGLGDHNILQPARDIHVLRHCRPPLCELA